MNPHGSKIIAVLLLGALGGCAATSPPTTVTVTTTTAAHVDAKSSRASHNRRHHKRRTSTMRSCDANIKVKRATTTCAFAENVFYAYWLAEQEPGVFADSPGYPAYSPAVDQIFYVRCSGRARIRCRGGDDAYISFSRGAIDAYTVSDAERYAERADLGDLPLPSEVAPEEVEPAPTLDGESGTDCDPNYEGACLDPNSPDYDCEGGSGDGPDYTGPVTVVGDDPFDLDRDGDGSACED